MEALKGRGCNADGGFPLEREIFPERYTTLEKNEETIKKIEAEIASSKEDTETTDVETVTV